MPDWKRVKITFPTEKLGKYIEPVKRTVSDTSGKDYHTVYGVTNTEGITVTGKKASKDISNYITVDEGCFAYNPYRINVGSIGFNDGGKNGCVSPAYVVFKAREGMSPDFLFYYLKSDFGNHLINWYGNRGGVRNALRYDDLCEIDVPIIDYQKQLDLLKKLQRTKTTLTQFDSGIDDQLVLLNKLRQQVLQEAIEGELTAKWRKHNPDLINGEKHASKLLEKIKAEKEHLLENGYIRGSREISNGSTIRDLRIPEQWVWAKGDDIFFVTKLAGFEYTKYIRLKESGDVPVIRAQNVRPINIATDSLLYIDLETSRNLERSALTKKCLLVTFIGAGIGDVATFHENNRWHLAPNVAKMEPYGEQSYLSLNYLNYYLMTKTGQNEIFKHVKATAKPCLSMGTIRDIDYPIPPIAEQQAIVECVDKIMAMIDDLEKQVAERKEQSEMLMQAVLSEVFAV